MTTALTIAEASLLVCAWVIPAGLAGWLAVCAWDHRKNTANQEEL